MARERKKPKDDKPIIPLHFQTWGDLMMNMLTLFILLCSFAKEKQAAFFAAGVGSFINAMESHGLPGLLPSDTKPIMLDAYDDRFKAPLEEGEKDDRDTTSYDTMDQIDLEEVSMAGEVWLPDAVYFPRGTAKLGKQEKSWLHDQMPLFSRKEYEIEVIGHAWQECCDDQASRKLSLRRAYEVIAYLNESGGVPLDRMHALAYGEARPLVEGENDPGLNRRVNFKLSKSR
ncbi:MAG: OmpA family protein [Planctomycetes bacterium]|nr:OmpA family protein [Planctomycetota bacterium]